MHHDATQKRQHEAVGRHAGSFQRAGRDHSHQCAIGNVDRRVDHHHQCVGDVGVNQLSRRSQVGRVKGQAAGDRKRNTKPDQVGTKPAPAGFGAVGDVTDKRVVDRIPNSGHQHHRAGRLGTDAKDVGVEVHQEELKNLPVQVGRCITHAVSDLLGDRQAFVLLGRSLIGRGGGR